MNVSLILLIGVCAIKMTIVESVEWTQLDRNLESVNEHLTKIVKVIEDQKSGWSDSAMRVDSVTSFAKTIVHSKKSGTGFNQARYAIDVEIVTTNCDRESSSDVIKNCTIKTDVSFDDCAIS